jgi:hypothetical protein
MAHYRAVVRSSAPAGDVYAYLADFSTIAEWDPGVRTAELTSGDAGRAGARYRVVTSNLGVSLPLDYDILEAFPPENGFAGRIVLEAHTADFRSYDVITVTPLSEGSEVVYDADLALKGVRRLFDPALRIAFSVIGGRAKAGLESAVQLRCVP